MTRAETIQAFRRTWKPRALEVRKSHNTISSRHFAPTAYVGTHAARRARSLPPLAPGAARWLMQPSTEPVTGVRKKPTSPTAKACATRREGPLRDAICPAPSRAHILTWAFPPLPPSLRLIPPAGKASEETLRASEERLGRLAKRAALETSQEEFVGRIACLPGAPLSRISVEEPRRSSRVASQKLAQKSWWKTWWRWARAN